MNKQFLTKKFPILLIVLCLYFMSVPAVTAGTHDNHDNHDSHNKESFQWKIDDYVTMPYVTEYRLSPDARRLVWSVTKWDLKTHTDYQVVYMSRPDKSTKSTKSANPGSKDIRLTRGTHHYDRLRWTPDGNAVSFITDKKFKDTKPNNVWLMPLTGGEPYPVTAMKSGVDDYAWLDKDNLLIIAADTDALWQTEIKKNKDTSVVVEDEEFRAVKRLFKYNIKSKKITRLTENKKPVSVMSLSNDKKHVVYGVSMSVRFLQNGEIKPNYFLLNLDTLKSKQLFPKFPHVATDQFYWEKNSRGFYFTAEFSNQPPYYMATDSKLFHFDLDSFDYREVDLDWERSFMRLQDILQVTRDGFIIQLVDGVRAKYARFVRKGNQWVRSWLKLKNSRQEKNQLLENFESFQLSADGKTMVYRYSTASLPPRYYVADVNGTQVKPIREMMDIKSPLHNKPLGKSEIRTWTGALKETVEGILYYPTNYVKGKKYPLILMPHGGPHYADMNFFQEHYLYPAHLWCERGAFVLKVNYHGSSNYGLKFGESIKGRYYELEVPDIEAGVDMLINEGLVDKDKLGIIGHSNGAILGTALILNSNRYKVAALNAGDVNWTSDYGNCSFGVTFDNYYFGGPPWENIDRYIKKSPLFQMKKVTTPTLIFHGDKDRSVPYSQSWEFYRALQVIGKAPVRFISFPGEGHVPRKIAHQRRKMQEEITWLEKYLFKNHKPKNISLKKDSPLAMLAKIRRIARHNGLYGKMVKSSLVPETVTYKKLTVGRYEVTRAQYAAFDKTYTYKPGTGNFPATGISIQKAKEYVEWLSKLTGATYGLPGDKEAMILYKEPSGNTFDHWAGYTVNPDDYQNLQSQLDQYGKEPVLLKMVGSFASSGEEMVYDLGGNAAEWIVAKDGKAKPCGGSAFTPADTKEKYRAPLHYTGFRVIKK
jgi:dipeptidyl aminopeptidase/acylaminoacyl peptidase